MAVERVPCRLDIRAEVLLVSVKGSPRKAAERTALQTDVMDGSAVEMVIERPGHAMIAVIERRDESGVTHKEPAVLP